MSRFAATLAAGLLLGAPLMAAARPPAPTASAPAWTVDAAASRLGFASRFNDEAFSGAFRRWTAAIRFDPSRLDRSSVVATIDLASAYTGSPDRDQSLPTSDWFDVAHHPGAVFRSTRIRASGPGRYVAEGVLTLRGVSRPLTLPFSLSITGQGAGQTARMTAAVALNRSAFGVGQGQWASGEVVPTTVQVTINLSARRVS